MKSIFLFKLCTNGFYIFDDLNHLNIKSCSLNIKYNDHFFFNVKIKSFKKKITFLRTCDLQFTWYIYFLGGPK